MSGRGYRFVADVQNGGAKPDIGIETRTTSHVLVEEEVVTEPETKSVIDAARTNSESGLTVYDVESRRNLPRVVDIPRLKYAIVVASLL